MRAISQEMPQPSITKISLKITYLKFYSNLSGANELSSFEPDPQLLLYHKVDPLIINRSSAYWFYYQHKMLGDISSAMHASFMSTILWKRSHVKTFDYRVYTNFPIVQWFHEVVRGDQKSNFKFLSAKIISFTLWNQCLYDSLGNLL